MKTFEQLAEEAYSIYRMSTAERICAQFMPISWIQMAQERQQAWIAATRHIVEQANQVH